MQPTRCLYAFRFISYGLLCEGGDLDLDRYPILIKKNIGIVPGPEYISCQTNQDDRISGVVCTS